MAPHGDDGRGMEGGSLTSGPGSLNEDGSSSWRQLVRGQVDDLGRWFDGRLVLDPTPSDEIVPAERFLDPDYLLESIRRARSMRSAQAENGDLPSLPDQSGAGDASGGADLDTQIALSRFARQYSSALTAVAMAGLVNGVGLDLSAPRCRMIYWKGVPFRAAFDPDYSGKDILRCAERPSSWPVDGPTVQTLDELRQYVWQKLYGEHLKPLFERATAVSGVSSALLWNNAAEWVGVVSDAAEEYLPASAAALFVAERHALLEAERLPGVADEINPLRGKLEWVPVDGDEFPRAVQTREMCCLTYLLADRFGRLCQNCPHLPVEDRVALIRERHGVPMGTAGGQAERRSIDVGLHRPSTQRILRAKQGERRQGEQ